jgi:hypothetical protein
VVGALDVAAGEELEDGAADLDEIAVGQHVLLDGLVVDVGAVGRAESRMRIDLPVLTIFECARDTDSWSIWMSDLDERPSTRVARRG